MPSSSRSGTFRAPVLTSYANVVSVPCRTLGESAVRRDTPSVIGRSSSNRTVHTMHRLGITVWATVWVAVDEIARVPGAGRTSGGIFPASPHEWVTYGRARGDWA